MYYERKMGNSSRTLKSQNSSSTQQMLSSPVKQDYSYWTGTVDQASYQLKPRYQHNDEQIHKYSMGGSCSNEFLQPQDYPSYRKKMMHQKNAPHSPSHNVRNASGTNEFSNRHSWLSTNYNSKRKQPNGNESQPYYGDEEPVYEEILSRTENCDGK